MDKTMDILKLHNAVEEGKKVRIRYCSYTDGSIGFYINNFYEPSTDETYPTRHKSDASSYTISGSMYHLGFNIKPIKVTKCYVIVDPAQTELIIPKEIERAFTLRGVKSHQRTKYFEGKKKKFYLQYTQVEEIL